MATAREDLLDAFTSYGSEPSGLVVKVVDEILARRDAEHVEEIAEKITSVDFWKSKHMAPSTSKQYVNISRSIVNRLRKGSL